MARFAGARAVVVGGSIGGLTAALLLRKLGFTVDVFERTPEQLDHRGGGIVLQPITMKWFDGHSARAITELSTSSSRLRYLGADNVVVHEEPAAWRYTSWGTVYRALLSDFGAEHYHLGEFCAGFGQDADRVELRFVSGRVEHADLAVFADGISLDRPQADVPGPRARVRGLRGLAGHGARGPGHPRDPRPALRRARTTASPRTPTRDRTRSPAWTASSLRAGV